METLLSELDTTRPALLPQIKVLRESNLVSKSGDTYQLTTIGKLIVEEMDQFLRTAEMFGNNSGYLGTHYIDFIPDHLLKRMPELGSHNVEDIPISEFFDVDREFLGRAINSNYWLEITSTLHPTFKDFYVDMTEHVKQVSVIVTQDLYDKMKKDYYEDLKELLDLNLITFYVYAEKLEFTSFTMTGRSLQFRLLTQEGMPDDKKLIFTGSKVVDWGKEFFDHYGQQAKPVIEV